MMLSASGLTAGLVSTLLILLPTPPAKVTRHEAKVRTFAALLRLTELRPDVSDATHANITVGSCKRLTANGWVCKGGLYPVAFSGIDGSVCSYIVMVTASRTRLKETGC